MTSNRRNFWTLSALLLLLALPLALAATGPKKGECIDDTGCSIHIDSATLEGFLEADDVFGKNNVYAGGSNESLLNANGLFATEVEVDIVDAITLYAANKYFRIDHPLDPANRYLHHWSVESAEAKNIYDGVVSLDASGAALVTLPQWFDSLNRDFRYQLTALGGPGRDLHVAEEITDRKFKIAGGTAGAKVSWQVTGVRHDASALRDRTTVEQDKAPQDRGRYVDPAAFGQPESLGLHQPTPQKPLAPKAANPKHDSHGPLACIRGNHTAHAALAPLGALGAVGLGTFIVKRRKEKAL